ncbi:MAG: sensor histidine kinase, partial [Mucilaginibacter sp.]
MSFRGKVSGLWVQITGDPSVFPLEYRIFHSICFITILLLAYTGPFNFMIGLYASAYICLVTFLIFSYLYYRSRVKGKMRSS